VGVGSLYRRKKKLSDGTIAELPTWWLKYYQHGRQVRESSGTTNELKARRALRLREGDVEHGIPINPKMGRVTFEDAADDILNDYRANHRRSLANLKQRLRLHLKPYFRGRLLASISTVHIRAFIAHRQQQGVVKRTGKQKDATGERRISRGSRSAMPVRASLRRRSSTPSVGTYRPTCARWLRSCI
jgi:hypothetical protein